MLEILKMNKALIWEAHEKAFKWDYSWGFYLCKKLQLPFLRSFFFWLSPPPSAIALSPVVTCQRFRNFSILLLNMVEQGTCLVRSYDKVCGNGIQCINDAVLVSVCCDHDAPRDVWWVSQLPVAMDNSTLSISLHISRNRHLWGVENIFFSAISSLRPWRSSEIKIYIWYFQIGTTVNSGEKKQHNNPHWQQ